MEISLSAIVPFFNEEKFLKSSVERLITTGIFNEILLIDNNSTDNSLKIANQIQLLHQNITIHKTDKVPGKGNAVRHGLNFVKTTHMIVHDADLEYFPSDIVEMKNLASKYPDALILGSRVIGNKKRNNLYKKTYIFNRVFSVLFSILNFTKVSDISSCYQLNNTKNIKNLDLKENGFGIEVEILSKHLKNSGQIKEIAILYDARSYEDGKKIKVSDGVKIFWKIITYSKLNLFSKFSKK